MGNQINFTDMEYSRRKRKTKREEFLEIMNEIIPWDEWVKLVEPYYPVSGKRGCQPKAIETMLRCVCFFCKAGSISRMRASRTRSTTATR